jgi:hypothetical protein
MKRPFNGLPSSMALLVVLAAPCMASPGLVSPSGLTFPPSGTNTYQLDLFVDPNGPSAPMAWSESDWSNHLNDPAYRDANSNLWCNVYSYTLTGHCCLPDRELVLLTSPTLSTPITNWSGAWFTVKAWTFTPADANGPICLPQSGCFIETNCVQVVYDRNGLPLATNWSECFQDAAGSVTFPYPSFTLATGSPDAMRFPSFYALREDYAGTNQNPYMEDGEVESTGGGPPQTVLKMVVMNAGPIALPAVIIIVILFLATMAIAVYCILNGVMNLWSRLFPPAPPPEPEQPPPAQNTNNPAPPHGP